MECAKGDDVNGATAKGGAVSSKGRCDPVAGCLRPNSTVTRSKHPRHCPIPASQGPSGYALGRSFARSLTKQTARKASSHSGCGKIGRDRAGRSSFFQRKMRPRSGLLAPHCTLPRSGIPAAARSPLRGGPRATLWGAMALRSLGIVVPATTCVARVMIIPILPATRSARFCSAVPQRRTNANSIGYRLKPWNWSGIL
jgi:hypothetical protein